MFFWKMETKKIHRGCRGRAQVLGYDGVPFYPSAALFLKFKPIVELSIGFGRVVNFYCAHSEIITTFVRLI